MMRRIFLTVLIVASWSSAAGAMDMGPRAGVTGDPGDFYIGLELVTPARVGPARFAPSLDLELGDLDAVEVNGDLRWDLLPIPETGLVIYGKAGPTLLLADGGNEVGLYLSPGVQIPMRSGRKLQVEVRFGFGDVPDRKIGAAVLFGF